MNDKRITYFINELKNFNPNKEYTDKYYKKMEALGDKFFAEQTMDAIYKDDLARFKVLNLYNIHFTEDLYNKEVLEYIINKHRNEFMVALVESNAKYVGEFYDILRELDWEHSYVSEALEELFYNERICDISQDTEWFTRYDQISTENQIIADKSNIEYSINDVYKLIIDAFIEKSITEAEFLTKIKEITNENYKTILDGSKFDFERKHMDIVEELDRYKDDIIDLIYETYINELIDNDDLVKGIKAFVECTDILLNNKA